jgi:serine/threonine protein kinase
MTLTTHGTEYFRDPELVRMALKGVKVHEVDGTKFDIFAAGAVLYSMIENSFPAHGVLSQITKRCPEALRWIVRRAMTDYDKRYRRRRDARGP